jgi:DNA polymerase-3 subunit delta'
MTGAVRKLQQHLIGHEWAVNRLESEVAQGRVSQAYLFTGPRGIGKTSLALFLACALNCTGRGQEPCGQCVSCRKILRSVHPDVRLVGGEGAKIKIEQIREIQREIALAPFESPWKVYVLRDFHYVTPEAANCLLKTLEEPPPRVVLILTASRAGFLLPTIVSRCRVVPLRPPTVARVREVLVTGLGLEPGRAELLARLSRGRVGWALEAASDDELLRDREKHFVALEEALRQGVAGRLSLAQQLCRNGDGLPDLLDSWQSWWRDLLLIKTGSTDRLNNVDRQPTLKLEAGKHSLEGILHCLRSIHACVQHLEHNVNPCLALEVLVLHLGQPSVG